MPGRKGPARAYLGFVAEVCTCRLTYAFSALAWRRLCVLDGLVVTEESIDHGIHKLWQFCPQLYLAVTQALGTDRACNVRRCIASLAGETIRIHNRYAALEVCRELALAEGTDRACIVRRYIASLG